MYISVSNKLTNAVRKICIEGTDGYNHKAYNRLDPCKKAAHTYLDIGMFTI